MDDQLSLENMDMFDGEASNDSTGVATAGARLDVVKMSFDGVEAITWQDLFSGYDRLYAITYSSGIDFICRLINQFAYAEIIFGCEAVISSTLQEVMAYQSKLIERLRSAEGKTKEILLSRIDNGTLRFYVAKGQLSHEKIYLLENQDGEKRVITGSANMSYQAFGGVQRENICYVNGDRAFDWYMGVFKELKESSTDEITRRCIELSNLEENIDELPISHTIKVSKAMIFESSKEQEAEINFILDVKKAASKLAPMIPKGDKKTGKAVVSPDTIQKIRRQVQSEAVKERELRSEYPQLVVDVDRNQVSLNGNLLDLHPSGESVRSDVGLFLHYMDGYQQFHGDTTGMQYRYFEFANWFFCSPFMAVMRDMAARYDQKRLPYPIFGLVYGQSKAGKTSFLETLLKMMIGQKPKVAAPEFTRSSIENLKRTVQGAPIIVDDLTQNRFNQHAIETIKNDDFGVSDHLIHYPAVVISANEDVKAVAPEVIRRTVICRVEAGLTNTEVMKSNIVRKVQQQIGTAFYREYLRRMLDVVPDMIEQLRQDGAESAPDILKCSSDIIVDIFSEYTEELPPYVRHLSLEDYFSEKVTGKYAIKTIRTAWRTNRNAFVVNVRNNEIRYNAGTVYEADRLIKELPETLEARKSRDWVVMNLDEAKSFFNMEFKMPFLSRFRR